jgi:hypothetical protein
LAYQPPASSTFLSQQTSHQPAVLFSQNKPAPAISHQPTEQAAGLFIHFHNLIDSCVRSLRAFSAMSLIDFFLANSDY